MRIFIAGATGTLGRPVVRKLLTRGHDVFGMTRSGPGAVALNAAGVHGIVADALDQTAVRAAVAAARPDVVVHLLTALPVAGPFRPFQLKPTNVLRTTGTANLLGAAVAAGASSFVAESFATVYGIRKFAEPVDESAPLVPVRRGPLRDTILALRSLEDQLRAARDGRMLETVALRIGFLYGSGVPGTKEMAAQARAGRLFVPRSLHGVSTFVHLDDAADGIVAAIERPSPAPVYNLADDAPIELVRFIDLLAETVGAPRPRSIPAWVVRLAAPVMAEFGVAELRLSNRRAKQELGWSLRYPDLRGGLRELRTSLVEAA